MMEEKKSEGGPAVVVSASSAPMQLKTRWVTVSAVKSDKQIYKITGTCVLLRS